MGLESASVWKDSIERGVQCAEGGALLEMNVEDNSWSPLLIHQSVGVIQITLTIFMEAIAF